MILLQHVTISVSIRVVAEIKQIGTDSDFPANQQEQGSGEVVCSFLYKLGQKVLGMMKINLIKPQSPDSSECEEENKKK